MKRTRIGMLLLFVTLAAALGLLPVAPLLAQTGGGYDLTWSTIDGGGYTFSSGGGYTLAGTSGQPDAGLLTGGGYTLAGGFWAGGAAATYQVHLPLVLRNYP
jgi:hypothetical protein